MKQSLLLGLLIVIALTACKKKNDTPDPVSPTPETPAQNYIPMKVGNYWIYERYTVDPNGNETYDQTDSVYISKDTIIGSDTYYIFEGYTLPGGVYPPRLILRQQGSDLLLGGGVYYYKHDDTLTVLEDTYQVNPNTPGDTITHFVSRMGDINKSVTVGAGTFSTHAFKTTVAVWPNYKNCCDTLRTARRFAKDVGMISDVAAQFVTGTHIDRRLKRYHLN